VVIVPSVDVRNGRASFGDGSPGELARRFVEAGAEELHLVDLDAAEHGVARNARLLEGIAARSGVPCRLAGGLSDLARANAALERGFAGVLFSSAVFGDAGLLREIAGLGDRAIVELESRDGALAPRGGAARLVDAARGMETVGSALLAAEAGVGGLYVIDLGGEGRLRGPALALLDRVRAALERAGHRVALHTGGGVRDLDDVRALAGAGAASAVVGRALAEGRFTIAEAKAACA
jgi:phosphoribosylformimino-5-aminoimidazole carboxamide ribotide isomerase